MYINGACILAILGLILFGDVSSEDLSRRPPDAIIYIDNSQKAPQAPPQVYRENCKKYNVPGKYGEPVCTKSGQTFTNEMYLNCINRKRPAARRFKLSHNGPCKRTKFLDADLPPECERDMLYHPVCGSDNLTYANVGAINCKNALVPRYNVRIAHEGECIIETCPDRGDLNKVCASNGITYRNIGEVKCMKKHHPGLHVLHAGGCSVREVRRAMGKRIACHTAKNRFEWNPVCGQNNLTYANPYLYICHRPRNETKCATKPGECKSLHHLACLRAEKINRNEIKSTSLVCATNGATYRSYEHLHCSSFIDKRNASDKYLSTRSVGKCPKSYNPCSLISGPLMDAGQPVCGTDKQTYASIESLWCVARLSNRDLKYLHDGRCL